MQATSRDLREGEKLRSKIANDRTWKPPVLRPAPARPLDATWVAMRLKSGKAGDSFWPGTGIRAEFRARPAVARFAVDILLPFLSQQPARASVDEVRLSASGAFTATKESSTALGSSSIQCWTNSPDVGHKVMLSMPNGLPPPRGPRHEAYQRSAISPAASACLVSLLANRFSHARPRREPG
jgi:hypothetical protein